MKRIPLTHEQFAVVDDSDFEWLSQWRWYACRNCKCWYAHTNINGRNVQMHQLLCVAPKGYEIDHKNNDGLDNRRDNLRICTHAQNIHNQKIQTRPKTSRFKGVRLHSCGTWEARIRVAGSQLYLGHHNTESAAALAYNEAAQKYHGEFAYLNPL